MRLKDLTSALQGVERFGDPKYELEQYNTSAALAANLLFTIESSFGDLDGKVVADFGCGTGVLAIGAELMGAAHTIGVDVDADALERAKANIADYELDIDLVHADIGGEDPLPLRPGLVDTVVMNPPFGTRVKGVDLEFVRRALSVASTAVYSLHKTSTRSHIARKATAEWGVEARVLAEMRFDVPKMYAFHTEKSKDIAVDFWRFGHLDGVEGEEAKARLHAARLSVPSVADDSEAAGGAGGGRGGRGGRGRGRGAGRGRGRGRGKGGKRGGGGKRR